MTLCAVGYPLRPARRATGRLTLLRGDTHGEEGKSVGWISWSGEIDRGAAGGGEPRQCRALPMGKRLRRMAPGEGPAVHGDRGTDSARCGGSAPLTHEGAAVFLHPVGRSDYGSGEGARADPGRKRPSHPARRVAPDSESIVEHFAAAGDLASA